MSEEATLDDFTENPEEAKSQEGNKQELFGLGEIPADWSIEPLSGIAQIIPGNSPPSSTYNENGQGLPFFQGNSEFGHFYPEADTWCSDPRKEAEKNDILMSIRAPVGDLNIADRNCCIGRGLAALRPKSINGLYLFYNLAERKPWLSRLATGSTFKSVTKGDLQLLDVPVPPFEEQRKITTVLYTVDQAIQKTEEIIEQTERTKRGVAQELFHHSTNEQDTVDTWLGKIPETWEVLPFKEIVKSNRNGLYKSKDAYGDGYPIAKMGNALEKRVLDMSTADRLELTESEQQKYALQQGDLIFARRAQEVSGAGDCCYVPDLKELTAFESSLIRVRLTENADPRFYVQYFEGPVGSKSIERIITETSISGIATSDLLELKTALPPLEEQHEIASILWDFDRQVQALQNESTQYKQLKRGLMQDLLSGTVRTTNSNIQVLPEVEQHG